MANTKNGVNHATRFNVRLKRQKGQSHTSGIRGLQKSEQRNLKENKKVTTSTKVDLKLDVPGVDEEDEKGKANATNDKCLSRNSLA